MDHPTFADHIIQFNREIEYNGELPDGIRLMNPFRENAHILSISEKFYKKFYDDHQQRKLILGINPGRFGAGTTGIPFTDTKRLQEVCGIPIESPTTHEPSSVFVYDVIDRYGGPGLFCRDFYINSISPLGFIRLNKKGNWVNCNYYDYESLFRSLEDWMVTTLKQQITFGLETDVCYVLGKKNARYLERINKKEKLFGCLVVLDHPRYIVQYKSRLKEDYIREYLDRLTG
ncbi:MAG: SMUG2 DNA glycosylase family protein [Bacteroidales bacterium]|nr:SMUG2 DNA glycosylase family protein [Bacteroidales bacterium]